MSNPSINKDIASKHHANLLKSVNDALKAIVLFKSLREEFSERKKNPDISPGGVARAKRGNLIEDAVFSYLVIKMYIVFDTSRQAFCLDKFLLKEARYLTDSENIKRISELFSKLKIKHSVLIERVKNNRNNAIAHVAKSSPLGVSEEAAKKIRELGERLHNEEYAQHKSVEPHMEQFSVGNFPTKEAQELEEKLLKIIFALIYPKTLSDDFVV